jgi:hypothetical protein
MRHRGRWGCTGAYPDEFPGCHLSPDPWARAGWPSTASWPLSQIVHDTQYYVRDAVINYIKAQPGPISPAIEGRLIFK